MGKFMHFSTGKLQRLRKSAHETHNNSQEIDKSTPAAACEKKLGRVPMRNSK
jgi:hypothetical protein